MSGDQPLNLTLLSSIGVPLIVLILIANAAAIFATLRIKRLRRLRHIPLISLAVADLLIGLLVGPLFIAAYASPKHGTFCATYLFIEKLCFTASLSNMFVAAIERSVIILKPLRFARYLTTSVVWGMVTSAWILPLLMAFSQPGHLSRCRKCRCIQILKKKGVTSSISLIGVFAVLSLIMVVMQVKTYLVVKSHRRRIVPGRVGEAFNEEPTSTDRASVAQHCPPNSESAIEYGNREARTSNARMEVEAVALTLAQKDEERGASSIFVRFLNTEQHNKKGANVNQNSTTTHLTEEASNNFANTDNLATFRPETFTIFRSSERPLGAPLQSNLRASSVHRSKAVFKTTQFASFIYLVFILLWTPYLAVVLMRDFGYDHRYDKKAHHRAFVSTKLVLIANSLVNPFVHTIRMRKFRNYVKECFRSNGNV